jgi:hypothetical protein
MGAGGKKIQFSREVYPFLALEGVSAEAEESVLAYLWKL